MAKEEKNKVVESTWNGRSLANYISMHPKAAGAKTLTQARALAFGAKKKNYGCKCGQTGCKRSGAGKASNC